MALSIVTGRYILAQNSELLEPLIDEEHRVGDLGWREKVRFGVPE